MKPATETLLVKACLALLQLHGIPAWRSNTGAVAFGTGKARRFVRFNPPGMADIIGILPPHGKLIAVEVKRPGGRVRPEQQAFLQRIRDAGGVAIVVRDVAELDRLLSEVLHQ